jgi:hypothetical protein
MFDVYLSAKRDQLLVVVKGQPIPLHLHLERWRKKRSAIAVNDEIKMAIQRDGYYSRSLRGPQRSKAVQARVLPDLTGAPIRATGLAYHQFTRRPAFPV